jgi:hypothetical protein
MRVRIPAGLYELRQHVCPAGVGFSQHASIAFRGWRAPPCDPLPVSPASRGGAGQLQSVPLDRLTCSLAMVEKGQGDLILKYPRVVHVSRDDLAKDAMARRGVHEHHLSWSSKSRGVRASRGSGSVSIPNWS